MVSSSEILQCASNLEQYPNLFMEIVNDEYLWRRMEHFLFILSLHTDEN